MAIPLSADQVDVMLEAFPASPTQTVTPQSMFGLPPPVPTTNYFGGGRGSRFASYRGNADPTGAIERAAEVRMKIAAEQQAQQVGQILQGIDPTSRNYPQQRAAVIAQFPYAQVNQGGKALIDAYDYAFKEASSADPYRSLLERAAYDGVTAEEVSAFRRPDGSLDTVALGNLAGERKRANQMKAQPRDRTISELTEYYNGLSALSGEDARKERERVAKIILQRGQEKFADPGATPAAQTPARVTIKSITPIE